MENQKPKKLLRASLIVSVFGVGIVLVIVAVILFLRFDRSAIFSGTAAPSIVTDADSAPQPDIALQEFSGDGYQVKIPESWYVEKEGSGGAAFYPDYSPTSSSSPQCKIALSEFSYSSSTGVSDWIAARIGADPTVTVVEQASENIPVSDATAIQWTGTIDGAATKLIYAFDDPHAYEIAPSLADGSAGQNSQCDDALTTFLSNFIF